MKTLLMTTTILFAQIGFAKNYTMNPQKGSVLFQGKAIGLKLEGKGEGPSGEIKVDSQVSGNLKFKLDTLNTQISLRDKHMKEKYLETSKYPNAELKLEEVTGFKEATPEGTFPFKGTLTVHNVPKPITGNVSIKKVGENLEIKAEFETKISNFNMPLPAYSGLTLKDDVKVVVESQL